MLNRLRGAKKQSYDVKTQSIQTVNEEKPVERIVGVNGDLVVGNCGFASIHVAQSVITSPAFMAALLQKNQLLLV